MPDCARNRGLDARESDSVAAEIARNAESHRQSWKLDDYAVQLAVYSWDDHMVTAGPLPELARLTHADTLVIASPCGHVMMFCEQARVAPAVRAFIER